MRWLWLLLLLLLRWSKSADPNPKGYYSWFRESLRVLLMGGRNRSTAKACESHRFELLDDRRATLVPKKKKQKIWSRCVKKSVWALHRVHWCSRWCKPDRQVYPNVQSGRPPDVRDMLEAGWFVPCGGWVLTEVSGSPWELDLKIEKKLYWLLWIFYWLLVKFRTFIHTFVDNLWTFANFCGFSKSFSLFLLPFVDILWIFEEFLFVLVTFREHSVDFRRLSIALYLTFVDILLTFANFYG